MGVCFAVEILPREAQVKGELLAIAVRVFIGHVRPKRIIVVPPPDRGSSLVRDRARGVQLIGIDVEDRRRFILPFASFH